MCFIGPPAAFISYTGGDVPFMLARFEIPPEHPAQLKIAQVEIDSEWDGGDIEPMRGGAFACCAGIVISRNCRADICLYNERIDSHTLMRDFRAPCMN